MSAEAADLSACPQESRLLDGTAYYEVVVGWADEREMVDVVAELWRKLEERERGGPHGDHGLGGLPSSSVVRLTDSSSGR